MGHLETDDAQFAEAEVRRSDDAHASRMHDQFGVTWGDPVLYDLVLNKDRVSVESCVEQISRLASRAEFAETPDSRALLANMALQARMQAALKGGPGDPRHQHDCRSGPRSNHPARDRSQR